MKTNKFQKVRISDIAADVFPVKMVTITEDGELKSSFISISGTTGNIDGGSALSNYIFGQNIEGGASAWLPAQVISGGGS